MIKELKSSVHKTFSILEYFTEQKPDWGVTEHANEIGSNKSTVYRFLSDMHQMGILHKHPDTEKYSLGLKLFELGSRVKLKSALVDKTHPVLESVANSIKETVHISVLKNNQVFYIDKVESPQGLKISSHIGSFNPVHATALGKVLLAFLPYDIQQLKLEEIFEDNELIAFTQNTITDKITFEKQLEQIRKRGFALDKQEFEIGLICVAIPIFNQNNEVVASLSASGPANRFKKEELENYVATLQKGAHIIRKQIGQFRP
jgi:IclR family KDG regulon transcriptional repressor